MIRIVCVFLVFLTFWVTTNIKTYFENGESVIQRPESTPTVQSTATQTLPVQTPEPTKGPLIDPQTGKIYYQYETAGRIRDWATEADLIYIVFFDDPRYMVFDSNNGEILKDIPLWDTPAELHLVENEIWISYPALKSIKIYDKITFQEKRTIQLKFEVYSFDLYENYLFYTISDGSPGYSANRYDLLTQEEVPVLGGYSDADILINAEDKLIYVGESGNSGCGIYCLDLETFEVKSRYLNDDYGFEYGFMNYKRKIFLKDGSVYWAEFKLNAQDVSQVEFRYLGLQDGGMVHVDEHFIITTDFIYSRSTNSNMGRVDLERIYQEGTITASGNFMYTDLGVLYIYPKKFDRT